MLLFFHLVLAMLTQTAALQWNYCIQIGQHGNIAAAAFYKATDKACTCPIPFIGDPYQISPNIKLWDCTTPTPRPKKEILILNILQPSSQIP